MATQKFTIDALSEQDQKDLMHALSDAGFKMQLGKAGIGRVISAIREDKRFVTTATFTVEFREKTQEELGNESKTLTNNE